MYHLTSQGAKNYEADNILLNLLLGVQTFMHQITYFFQPCKEEYQNHIALKLNDPMTTIKAYWTILKTFYNGKKIPIVPPLLINDKLISDFEVKANHFNNFFASQCTPFNNSSKIPKNQPYITNTKLTSIKFENKEIINIIRSLSVGKTHGHDNISIRMLQICNSGTVQLFSIIFNNCINQSMFPDIWKRSNISPIHKKGDKQLISNYRPVLLLTICGKIFEKLIFYFYINMLKKTNQYQCINLVFGLMIHV